MAQTQVPAEVASLSPFVVEDICQMALNITKQIFSRPGEMERYQAWLKEYRQKQCAAEEQNSPDGQEGAIA